MTTLSRVVGTLEAARIESALIGAMALAVRGVTRSTFYIDLLVLRPEALDRRTWAVLIDEGAPVEIRHGDASDPLEGIVRLRAAHGPAIDVIVGRSGWQLGVIERAERLVVVGAQVRVATAADLILLKLYAGGPSDRWDIEQLLGGDDRVPLIAEVESRLAQLPADCRTLWSHFRER